MGGQFVRPGRPDWEKRKHFPSIFAALKQIVVAPSSFPTEWNHSVDKKSLNLKELEHALSG